MDLSGFTALVALGLVIYTVMNVVKYAKGRQGWAAATPLIAWVVGFGAVWLLARSSFADQIKVGDGSVPLKAMSVDDLVLVGLFVASFAGFVDKFVVSRDNTQTAAVPSLSQVPLPKLIASQKPADATAMSSQGFVFA